MLGTATSATLTITDDDEPGTLALSAATLTVAEDAGPATLIVRRTGGSIGPVSIAYATANGTATAGADYTAASGTLSWAAGDTADRTIAIPILADAVAEADETFTVTLTPPSGGATLGSPASATVTITSGGNRPPVIVAGAAAAPTALVVP